jgi:aminoglycoside 6-adenylyltransferase
MADDAGGDPVLRRVIAWGARQEAVRAALLTSTRARPGARLDAFSDYDVVLVARDIQPFLADRRWIADFGDVLVTYWDPFDATANDPLASGGNVVQYADGLKIDFRLWPVALLRQVAAAPALPPELDAGYRVLLDKDGLTAGLAAPTYRAYIPARPTAAEFATFVEEFFSDVPYVVKCLRRGDLLPVKWALDYDMKHVYLRRLLEWRVEVDHDWALPLPALGNGLRARLPPTIWAALEATYAGADLAANADALFGTLALFSQVAREVAAGLGYGYPQELEARVTAFAQARLPPAPG